MTSDRLRSYNEFGFGNAERRPVAGEFYVGTQCNGRAAR